MTIAVLDITGGNIRNDSLNLASVMEIFPESAIGGTSKAAMAPRLLELHVGFDEPIETDIAGDKKMFRKRSWLKKFFKRHDLNAGDKVVIEKMSEFRYHIYPQRG